jgi:DtxR family Mn-dependent transcriptional regulator
LAESGHVQHIPYKGVRLTESGKNNALKVVRRHRLLELYLYSELGFSWDKVHEEAERLEHVISEEFEQKIDEKMGFPTLDPHGAPIPDGNGECGPRPVLSLMELRVGQRGTVQAVTDKDPAMLRFMDSIGMGLGTHVEVVKKEPFGGSIIVKIDAEAEEPIGSRLAKEVFIQIQDPVEA